MFIIARLGSVESIITSIQWLLLAYSGVYSS